MSTGRELSFEWSHHAISSTDSKFRVILQNSIMYSGSERVNYRNQTSCRLYFTVCIHSLSLSLSLSLLHMLRATKIALYLIVVKNTIRIIRTCKCHWKALLAVLIFSLSRVLPFGNNKKNRIFSNSRCTCKVHASYMVVNFSKL